MLCKQSGIVDDEKHLIIKLTGCHEEIRTVIFSTKL